MLDFDLYIAGGLVVVALVVFFVSQIGLLPRKSLPLVAGALLGGLGFIVFGAARRRALEKQLKDVKAEVDRRQKQLDQMEKDYQLTARQVAAERVRLEDQITAREKEILTLKAQNAAERDRIDHMTPAEVRTAAGTLGIGG